MVPSTDFYKKLDWWQKLMYAHGYTWQLTNPTIPCLTEDGLNFSAVALFKNSENIGLVKHGLCGYHIQ